MSKFMLLFRGGGYADSTSGGGGGGAAAAAAPSPTELQAHLARWTAWSDSLLKAGKLAGAHALTYPVVGKTVRGREKVVTDGPYAESKDLVSGVIVVEVASIEEASEIARGCPILEHDSGSVEVRPVQ